MKIIHLVLLLFVLFSNSSSTSAQTTDSTKKEKVQFKFSINHNSGLHYYGRTDSLKSKGFFPLAEIWFTPKYYVNVAPVFVYNQSQTLNYTGSVATLGYLNISKKWISNIYLLKPFYKESSELVQSALKAQTGASVTFLSKILNISAGGDIKYSKQLDYGAMAGIDRIFRKQFKNQSVLIVDPTFSLNAGTQNFSRTYIKKTGSLLPRQQLITENVQAFNLLSMEASLPVIYTKSKLQFIVIPAYVLPKNLIKTEGQSDLGTGENLFYTTLTAKYNF